MLLVIGTTFCIKNLIALIGCKVTESCHPMNITFHKNLVTHWHVFELRNKAYHAHGSSVGLDLAISYPIINQGANCNE